MFLLCYRKHPSHKCTLFVALAQENFQLFYDTVILHPYALELAISFFLLLLTKPSLVLCPVL